MSADCWAILDIAATVDEREIRRAYARQLKFFRPDEDPVGFQRLVEARDRALLLADASRKQAHSAPEQILVFQDNGPANGTELSEAAESSVATNFDTVAQTEAKAGERELLRAVYETLDGLIGAIKGNTRHALDAWKAERWSALFNQAALLGLDEHRGFQQTIARRLAEFLPDPGRYQSDDLVNFEAGLGPMAVVEQIEKDCQFSWFGVHFAELASRQISDRYFSWLVRAQEVQSLIGRRQAPETSYRDLRNGLPLFLDADKVVLFRDDKTWKFFVEAEKKGRWPIRIDIKSLLTPGARLVDAGFKAAGFAVAAFICALSATLNTLRVDWFMTAVLCLCASLVCRACFSATHHKRTVQNYIRYVREADIRGMIFPAERRDFLAVRRRRPALAGHLWVMEIAATIMIIFPIYTFAMGWFYKDLLDQPAETVLTEQIASLFEITARNEAVDTVSFLKLLNGMKNADSQIGAGKGHAENSSLLDLQNPLSILSFRPQLANISKTTTQSPQPLLPIVARGRKLEMLAELYRQSSPDDRRNIERTISRWGALLGPASTFNPRFEALLWELLPPRTSETQSLISPEQELRQLIIEQFLEEDIASIATFEKQNIAEKAARLQTMLLATDNLLLSSVNDAVANQNLQFHKDADRILRELSKKKPRSNFSESAQPILEKIADAILMSSDGWETADAKRNSDSLASLSVFNEPLSVWSEEVLGWGRYLNIVGRCLNAVAPDDRIAVRTAMLAALQTAQSVNRETRPQYWASASSTVLDMPLCDAHYSAFGIAAAGNASYLTNSALSSQLGELILAEDTDRARVAAHYTAAIAEGRKYGDDRLKSFANSYLAYDQLQKNKPQQALYYLDVATDQFTSCRQTRALRGTVLRALGENQRASQEFQTAQSAHLCSSLESVFSYNDTEIAHAIEQLENDDEGSRRTVE